MTITSVLHVAGLVTGLGLYGLLLSLALHRRAAGGGSAAGLTLATAMLGLMWNAGALLGGGADGGDLPRFAVALAYAALGLLPAVFIDTALASGHGSSRGARVSRAAAYALAATAAGLHLFAWQTGGDYLLKPVEPVRLAETLDRARRRLKRSGWRRDAMPRFEGAARVLAVQGGYLERIPVRRRDDILILPVEQIASIVAEGELLHLTTARNERHVITYRLKDVEARLDPRRFVRLSRGTLANLRYITRFAPLPGGLYQATLANGQELTVSRSQSRVLRDELFRL